MNLTFFFGIYGILFPLCQQLSISLMYWGSSTVQVSFIKKNRMRNWDQNDFRFISKILKFYKKHRKMSGRKQSGFYLQVNSMKKRQFLFTALLLVPRIMPEPQNSGPHPFWHQGRTSVMKTIFPQIRVQGHQKTHCLHVSAIVDYFLVSTLAISLFFTKFIISFTLIVFTSCITMLYSSCKLLYRIFYSSINHNGQNNLPFLFCHIGGIALSLMPPLRCY